MAGMPKKKPQRPAVPTDETVPLDQSDWAANEEASASEQASAKPQLSVPDVPMNFSVEPELVDAMRRASFDSRMPRTRILRQALALWLRSNRHDQSDEARAFLEQQERREVAEGKKRRRRSSR